MCGDHSVYVGAYIYLETIDVLAALQMLIVHQQFVNEFPFHMSEVHCGLKCFPMPHYQPFFLHGGKSVHISLTLTDFSYNSGDF